MDRESPDGLFLLFGDAFVAPGPFVTKLGKSLQEELKLTNSVLPPSEQRPPLPAEFLDPKKSAPVRLEAGLAYAQSLIKPKEGQKFVWAMGPDTISDPKAYLELLALLAPRPDIRPWMRGARIVARVPVDFQLDRSPFVRAKRVNVEPFVIPPDAHEQGLLADASDPKVPIADRMQAEVQLAYLDYAHSRFDQAIERFNKALAFFQWAGVPVMEGLIISGLGDIERRKENWKQAEHWYSCATVPAAEAASPILLANIVQNLAVCAYQDKRWAEAEERYTELVELKQGMLDEVGLAESLEWRGLCQEKQNAYDRAVESWESGASVCQAFEMEAQMKSMLGHLRRGYEKLKMHDELEHFDVIWRAG